MLAQYPMDSEHRGGGDHDIAAYEARLPSRLNPVRPRAKNPLTPTEQEAQLDTLRALVDAGIDRV